MSEPTNRSFTGANQNKKTGTNQEKSTDSNQPEQDGSEDPGAGLEPLHDQGVVLDTPTGMPSTTNQPTSPSAVEHVDNTSDGTRKH